jgi:pimeloyl-ACP methyl ester carboxylesterase
MRAVSPAVLLAAALASTFALSEPLAARSQRVTFRTDDGLTLAAIWYEPSRAVVTIASPPAVILVHMLQRSKRDWDPLATRLAGEGVGALALDLRGHGESPGNAHDYPGMASDLRAARRFLGSRGEVNAGRVGIVGASLGATLAAQASAEDASIAAAVLLSPSLDYRGVRIEPFLRKFGARPLLLVASDDDGYAARSMRDLQKVGGGIRETIVLSHAGHGTAMLQNDPDLSRRLVEWLRRTLL